MRTLLNDTKLLFNRVGWADASRTIFPFILRRVNPPEVGMIWVPRPKVYGTLTSMGFFGVKKRHPYPSGQRSYAAKAIINPLIVLTLCADFYYNDFGFRWRFAIGSERPC